jgi:hypothetical protein
MTKRSSLASPDIKKTVLARSPFWITGFVRISKFHCIWFKMVNQSNAHFLNKMTPWLVIITVDNFFL